jgi:hypothetical protein
MQCGITKKRNPKLKAYYDKKHKEGKPHKAAIIAYANKLIHWIYALLNRLEDSKVLISLVPPLKRIRMFILNVT